MKEDFKKRLQIALNERHITQSELAIQNTS